MIQRKIQEIISNTPKVATELGVCLYDKITEVVIPEWQDAFSQLTEQDCIDYIFNLTIKTVHMTDTFVRNQ